MKRVRIYTGITIALFILFAGFTLAVKLADVQAIGPEGSAVGFAALNGKVFNTFGVHTAWYRITGCLGVLCIAVAMLVAAIAVIQMIVRRSIGKIDPILVLTCLFYGLVVAFYLFFEVFTVNCRPVMLDGKLEASYPSSHTMLSICIMATSVPVVDHFLYESRQVMCFCRYASAIIIVFTVVGRLLSGVHWFTDIVGAVLLSGALVMLFYTAYEYMNQHLPDESSSSEKRR